MAHPLQYIAISKTLRGIQRTGHIFTRIRGRGAGVSLESEGCARRSDRSNKDLPQKVPSFGSMLLTLLPLLSFFLPDARSFQIHLSLILSHAR